MLGLATAMTKMEIAELGNFSFVQGRLYSYQAQELPARIYRRAECVNALSKHEETKQEPSGFGIFGCLQEGSKQCWALNLPHKFSRQTLGKAILPGMGNNRG